MISLPRLFSLVLFILSLTFPLSVDGAETTVLNLGIGGNNSADLVGRLDSVLEKEADLVVLLVGTNDMLNSGNAVSLPEYRANLARLVKRIEASGSRAVLITVPPCYEPYLLSRHAPAFYRPEGPNEKVKKVNGFLREFAVEKHLPLVDLYQLLTAIGQIGTEPESLLRNEANSGKPDGVHPTADGYRLMALAVYQAIQHHRLPHGRVVCLGDSITFGAGMPGAGTADGSTYPAFLKRLLDTSSREDDSSEE